MESIDVDRIPIFISSDDSEAGESDIAFVGQVEATVKPSKRPEPVIVDTDSESDSDDDHLPDLEEALGMEGFTPIKRAVTSEELPPKSRTTNSATAGPSKRKRPSASTVVTDTDEQNVPAESSTAATKRFETRTTDAATDAADRKAIREEQKVKEKERKQLEKAQAKAEKEAQKSFQRKVAEVNRLRTSKNDALREIELHLSSDLESPRSPIAGALPEIQARLKDNYCKWHFEEESDSPCPGVIRFKRHVKAKWEVKTKRFVPLAEPRWEWDKSILVIATAEEIVDKIIQDPTGKILNEWITDLRLLMQLTLDTQIVLLIKDLNKYHARTKTLANREFTAAARAALADKAGEKELRSSTRMERDAVERTMVELQVQQTVFIVRVERTEDVEDWIFNLAADIAVRPYKLLSKSHLSFAPPDHPRKASTSTDALELMLQEVLGITASAASGIASRYSTFAELMEAFERAERKGGVDAGEALLADCEIKNLRNGTASGRKLNKAIVLWFQALAKKVYQAFRGEDSLALA